jgi:ABC-type glycerol-3-phosphate transport system substrate-binding protein
VRALAIGAMVESFNASQTDVKINYQFQGNLNERTAQKLTAALQAKQTPDISLLSDVWVVQVLYRRRIVSQSKI